MRTFLLMLLPWYHSSVARAFRHYSASFSYTSQVALPPEVCASATPPQHAPWHSFLSISARLSASVLSPIAPTRSFVISPTAEGARNYPIIRRPLFGPGAGTPPSLLGRSCFRRRRDFERVEVCPGEGYPGS